MIIQGTSRYHVVSRQQSFLVWLWSNIRELTFLTSIIWFKLCIIVTLVDLFVFSVVTTVYYNRVVTTIVYRERQGRFIDIFHRDHALVSLDWIVSHTIIDDHRYHTNVFSLVGWHFVIFLDPINSIWAAQVFNISVGEGTANFSIWCIAIDICLQNQYQPFRYVWLIFFLHQSHMTERTLMLIEKVPSVLSVRVFLILFSYW